MKKALIFFAIVIIFSANFISAINLEVSSKTVSNSIISELDEPATFELTINNLEESGDFEIYSLIGVDISPRNIFLDSNKTNKITIIVNPQSPIKSSAGLLPFEYRIKNTKNEIQKEQLAINIVNLKDAFSITPESINPQSETINIEFKNRIMSKFENLKIKMTSAFFEYEETFSLDSSEIKSFNIAIDKEKLRTLNAGQYLLSTQIKTNDVNVEREDIIKFIEQEGIETIETDEGIIKKRHETIKRNIGNTQKDIEITAKKNLLSFLFTTANIKPTQTKISGFNKIYTWKKNLIPNEDIKIIVTTNWYYPIIVVVLMIVLFFFIKRSVEADLILRKKVSFVKTKGGQFALKITLITKSKKFLERINIVDKLPHLVKLYEKFGAIHPDKIDTNNRRLEWNIETLSKDEERIFTYIIYSRIGVVGRFELPEASATYEKEGKIKRTTSNRSFFINEPKSS